ncbi:MAG: DUF262 domain-containing protein, partial [Methanobacterium sp.]
YQRNYDWKREQCEQLFCDLIEVIENNFRNHFMGTIVSIYYYDEAGREYLIIDGQQRITTLSVLLLAIHNLLDKGEIEANFKKEQIKEDYLVNKFLGEEKKIRLKPIKEDNIAFSKLFENDEDCFVKDSNITENYKYFCSKLKDCEKPIDHIFDAIKRLFIVEIELIPGEDNPQLIFESINSTGLSLTPADLVRNFILMGLTDKDQKYYYEKYWNKIEINTGYKVSDFIRHYLTFKERKIPKQDSVYSSFKKYTWNYRLNTEDLLKQLLEYSKYYNRFALLNEPDKDLSEILERINKLNITVSYPFFLEIYSDYTQGVISKENLKEILLLVESFSFRRSICDVSPNALNKIYMTLGREIKNHPDFKENYVTILKYLLKKKKGSQRFPDDKEFAEKFMSKDIYNSKNCSYILGRIENFGSREKVDVENLLVSNQLTIEHIMPKSLSDQWIKDIGTNWRSIHENYLDTIGNITLTAYNKEMSNKNFNQKRLMENGFNKSKLFLNQYLKKTPRWNETTIKRRAIILKDEALKIWMYSYTEYISSMDISPVYLLSDEHNFTGEKIASFSFLGRERKATSWKKLYEYIARELYIEDPSKFKLFIKDSDFTTVKNKKYISDFEADLRSPIKISESLFLEGNLGTYYIVENIRKMMKKFGISEDELTIKLQKETQAFENINHMKGEEAEFQSNVDSMI